MKYIFETKLFEKVCSVFTLVNQLYRLSLTEQIRIRIRSGGSLPVPMSIIRHHGVVGLRCIVNSPDILAHVSISRSIGQICQII